MEQTVFDIVVGIAGFFGAFILNKINGTLDRLDDEIREFPKDYVSKDDYKDDITEIKTILNDIYKELRKKADK